MLLIAGRRITSPDDEDITAVFGLSYEQDRNVADIIDWCIEDQNYHYFGGPEAFRSYVMGSATTNTARIPYFSHVNMRKGRVLNFFVGILCSSS